MKSWLQDSNIEIYLTHNEEKSVDTERVFRIFKNKLYKHLNAVSKNVYVEKLDGIIDKYDITYHRTIKMKSNDVEASVYTDVGLKNKFMKKSCKRQTNKV